MPALIGRVRVLDTVFSANVIPYLRGVAKVNAASGTVVSPLKRVGNIATAAFNTAAIGAGAWAAFSIKKAADFDKAMTRSTAIIGDLSDSMRDRLEKAAREVAKTTVFSAEESAEAIFGLASAGLEAEQIITALPVVARFAQAGLLDMAEASDFLTQSQKSLGLTSKDANQNMINMTRISDVLTEVNNRSSGEVDDFAEALRRASGQMRVTGVSLEEGTAILGAFAAQGILGADAGDKFRVILRDLPRAIAANTEEFSALGLNVTDSSGNLRNMADVVAEFERVMGPMSDTSRQAAFDQIGLTRSARDAMIQLLGTSDATRILEKQLKSAGGATEVVAERQLQNLHDQWGLVVSRVEDAAISFGQVLIPVILNEVLPALESLVDFLQNSVSPHLVFIATIINDHLLPPFKDLAEAVGGSDEAMQLFGITIAGLITAGGIIQLVKMISLLGRVFGIIAAAKGAIAVLKGLAVFASFVKLAVQVFGFAGAIKVLAVNIVSFLGPAIAGIAGTFHVLAAIIGAPIAAFGALFSFIATFIIPLIIRLLPIVAVTILVWKNLGTILDVVKAAFRGLVGVGKIVLDVLMGIGRFIGNVLIGAFDLLGSAFEVLGDAWDEVFKDVIRPVIDGFNAIVSEVGPALSDFFTTIGEEAGAIGKEIGETFSAISSLFTNILFPIFSVAGTFIFNILKFVGESFINWAGNVIDILTPVVTFVVDQFRIIFEGIKFYIGLIIAVATPFVVFMFNIWKTVAENAISAIGAILQFVSPILAALVGAFQIAADVIIGLWKILWQAIGSIVGPILRTVIDIVRNFFVVASNFIQFFLNIIQGDWKEAFTNIKNIIVDTTKTIIRIIRSAIDIIVAVFRTGFNILKLVAKTVWDVIKLTIQTAWNFIKPIFNAIKTFLQITLGPAFKTFRTVVTNVWNGIKTVIRTVWNSIRDNILKPIGNFLENNLSDKFRGLKTTIKNVWNGIKTSTRTIWNNIKNAIKGPVNAVIGFINTLITGIEKIINLLPGLDDIDLPTIPRIGSGGGGGGRPLSRGGRFGLEAGGIPVTDPNVFGPFITNGMRAIVGEGRKQHPEFVIPTDPKFRNRALGLFAMLGNELIGGQHPQGDPIPMMGVGGVIPSPGDVIDTVTGAAGDVLGIPGDIASFFSEQMLNAAWGAVKRITNPLIDAIPAGFLRMMAKGMRNKVGEWVGVQGNDLPSFDESMLGQIATGGSGVARWRGVALKALAYTGSPASWINSLLRRMNQESGGNPRAINNWDINASRGDPSRGLMQTIGSTFNAYAGELRGRGIYDPFANIVASIRYANARYGSAPVGWNRPGGYERGAWRIPRNELASLHKDEMVVSNKSGQADRMREQAMEALLNQSGSGDTFVLNGITDVRKLSKEIQKEKDWAKKVAG